MTEPLAADIADRLRDIGLENPDPSDALHRRLVATLQRVRGGSLGAQIVAMKFDFNWELRAAGAEFATAKTDYEHYMDKTKAALMLGDGHSAVKADAIAGGSDEAYTMLLKYRLAEQRERALRKFLDTLDNRVEVWRSENANERRADAFHSQTAT
jgi:hypothetical protein